MEAILGCLFGIFAGYTTSVLFCINKIDATEREIANKKAMIKNRDEKLNKVISERNELREYKQDVKNILNSKTTIVEKYDKIIEVTTAGN